MGEIKLLDKVSTEIGTRHYSKRTEQAYVGWIRRFILFNNKKHLKEIGAEEIKAFINNLNSSQAAVYLDFVKVVKTGDVKTLKKVLAAEPAWEIDGTEGAEMLEFMQMGIPDKAEFQRK